MIVRPNGAGNAPTRTANVAGLQETVLLESTLTGGLMYLAGQRHGGPMLCRTVTASVNRQRQA
jgi:hypothetical protein